MIVGPTGVGKTKVSIDVAKYFHANVINADSRQIYSEIPIGTAAPTSEQLSTIKHYLVGCKNLTDYYSASLFEKDVLSIIDKNSKSSSAPFSILSGGSMLYIDAVCNGIDDIPTISDSVREEMKSRLKNEGLTALVDELQRLDNDYWKEVDKNNYRRVIHALEIIHQTGVPYSSFRRNISAERPFQIIKIGLNLPRAELYNNINSRVDEMIKSGLIDEARKVFRYRTNNALQTVGYRELFDYFDNKTTLDDAIDKIKSNTRQYARKQLTWFKRDKAICWFYPTADNKDIINYILEKQSHFDKNTK